MPPSNQNLNIAATRKNTRTVFFTGATALYEGMGVCFERDHTTTATGQTATDPNGKRDNRVELPNADNNADFAGVVARDYSAKSVGQNIEIYEPGSVCNIAVLDPTVVNVTKLTCVAGGPAAGYFVNQGLFRGRGTAKALQTTLTASASETGAHPVTSVLSATEAGQSSLSSAGVLTDTGVFANALAADRVIVVAGQKDNDTASDVVTPAETTISSRTDDAATLASSSIASDTALVYHYVVRGHPTVLALLDDGEESGLVQFHSTATGANTGFTLTGTTLLYGGLTLDAADGTYTLADAAANGMRKAFVLVGALETNDFVITVTSGIQSDGATALASAEFDAAADTLVLEWFNSEWQAITMHGLTIA